MTSHRGRQSNYLGNFILGSWPTSSCLSGALQLSPFPSAVPLPPARAVPQSSRSASSPTTSLKGCLHRGPARAARRVRPSRTSTQSAAFNIGPSCPRHCHGLVHGGSPCCAARSQRRNPAEPWPNGLPLRPQVAPTRVTAASKGPPVQRLPLAEVRCGSSSLHPASIQSPNHARRKCSRSSGRTWAYPKGPLPTSVPGASRSLCADPFGNTTPRCTTRPDSPLQALILLTRYGPVLIGTYRWLVYLLEPGCPSHKCF